MDDLDIVLLNIISFLGGTISGLAIGYKYSIACSSKPEQSPPRENGMSHSSSGMFSQHETVLASAPTQEQFGKEIVIRT